MFLSAVLYGASKVHLEEELKGMWFNKQGWESGAGKMPGSVSEVLQPVLLEAPEKLKSFCVIWVLSTDLGGSV